MDGMGRTLEMHDFTLVGVRRRTAQCALQRAKMHLGTTMRKTVQSRCNHLQRIERLMGRDRIVVSTLRCGRSNPGSNPGHGSIDNAGQAMEAFCACSSVNPDSLGNLVIFWI